MSANDTWYPETERLIAGYWHNQDRVGRLEAIEQAVLASIKRLEMELWTVGTLPGLVARYGFSVRGCGEGDSDYSLRLEQMETRTERLERQILEKHQKLVSIQIRLSNLREQLAPIEVMMSRLTTEERRLTELRYIYRQSNYQIAEILHCSEWRVRNMRNVIVRRVAEWFGKVPRNFNAPVEKNCGTMVS